MIFLLMLLSFSSVQAKELESSDFYLCIKKTALGAQSRNLRLHKFEKEEKCAVFYSVKGKDKILSSGKWLRFCKKKLTEAVKNLEKKLWNCKKKLNVQVFYPLKI